MNHRDKSLTRVGSERHRDIVVDQEEKEEEGEVVFLLADIYNERREEARKLEREN